MLRKIWAITARELYTTFTDRTLLLIMIVTPLAISTIIGLAFSGFIGGSNDVPIRDISLAIVNLDAGVTIGGQTVNQGAGLVDLLVPTGEPDPDNTLHTLTNAVTLTDADAARAAVDSGSYLAAIIIPADFSSALTVTQDQPTLQPVTIEVYASPAAPVSAGVARSIAQGFADQIAAGGVTIAATIDALTQRAAGDPAFGLRFATAAASGGFNPDFSAAYQPSGAGITLEQQTVSGETAGFNPLVSFGSAQALFFMMFTALGVANSLLEEKRAGTLQRQVATPTPRIVLLLGKMASVWVNCVVQVAILLVALTAIGSLIAGRVQFIWGDQIGLIALVVMLASLAAGGVGALVASLVRTPEQGNVVGSVVALVFGLFSGAFFSVEAIPGANVLSRLTVNYWGVEAFNKLAQGNTDIGLNLLVLALLGAAFFIVGTLIFSRRLSTDAS